jgi:hypothetical protein
MKLPSISAKLAAAIAPPLTTVTTAAIVTGTLDKEATAVLASVAIAGLLGYMVPHTTRTPAPFTAAPLRMAPIEAAVPDLVADEDVPADETRMTPDDPDAS